MSLRSVEREISNLVRATAKGAEYESLIDELQRCERQRDALELHLRLMSVLSLAGRP